MKTEKIDGKTFLCQNCETHTVIKFLPDADILDFSRLKAFADNKMKAFQMIRKHWGNKQLVT